MGNSDDYDVVEVMDKEDGDFEDDGSESSGDDSLGDVSSEESDGEQEEEDNEDIVKPAAAKKAKTVSGAAAAAPAKTKAAAPKAAAAAAKPIAAAAAAKAPAAGGAKASAAAAAAAASKPKTASATASKAGAVEAGAASSSSSAAAAAAKPSGGGGGGAGAPARKIVDPDEAEAAILAYMTSANRPYSSMNIFDNLHGQINKNMVQVAVTNLVNKGKLTAKEYGKSAIYWADQGAYQDVSQEALTALGEEEKVANAEAAAASAQRKALAQQVQALGNAMTLGELEEALKAARGEVAALKSKLDGLKVAQGGGQLVSKEKQATLKQTLERYRAAWKNRKAIVMELVGAMSEGLNRKPKDLLEKIGIETDEEAGQDIRAFV